MSRIGKLLRSTILSQSRRLDLALFRSGFALIMLSVMVLMLPLEQQARVAGATRPVYALIPFWGLSVFMMAWLSGRLTKETVGDAEGHLSLVYLTGISPLVWTSYGLLYNFIGFLSVWIVRWPFLCLFYTFGGMRISEVLLLECLSILIFWAVNARSMLVALTAGERKGPEWSGLQAIFLIEFTLAAPYIVVIIFSVAGIAVPFAVKDLAQRISEFGLFDHMQGFVTGLGASSDALWSIVPYSLAGVWWMVRYNRQLYARVGETPQPTPVSRKERKATLKRRAPLPRCWNDAIAWQSYVHYAGGHDNTTGRVILYSGGFLIILISALTGYLQSFTGLILVVAGVVLINVMNHPARCLENELKSRTIASLLLTPYSEMQLLSGWRRGTLWLAIPDFIFIALTSLVLSFVHLGFPLVILSIAFTALISGPLLTLSHLVPMSLRGLGVGFVVVMGLFGIVFIGVLGANISSSVMFPAIAIPLYGLFNLFLRIAFLKRWLRLRIEEAV